MVENSNIIPFRKHQFRMTRSGYRSVLGWATPAPPSAHPWRHPASRFDHGRPRLTQIKMVRTPPQKPPRNQVFRNVSKSCDHLSPRDRILIGLRLILDAESQDTDLALRFAIQRLTLALDTRSRSPATPSDKP